MSRRTKTNADTSPKALSSAGYLAQLQEAARIEREANEERERLIREAREQAEQARKAKLALLEAAMSARTVKTGELVRQAGGLELSDACIAGLVLHARNGGASVQQQMEALAIASFPEFADASEPAPGKASTRKASRRAADAAVQPADAAAGEAGEAQDADGDGVELTADEAKAETEAVEEEGDAADEAAEAGSTAELPVDTPSHEQGGRSRFAMFGRS